MASIRTLVSDIQYIDLDFTPTYINATSFSVPGNQTSAIHAGRRLKLFDGATVYGTVSTASFTTVTTINISADTGSLTSSLSSFGLSILSNSNNAIPRGMDLAVASLTVTGVGAISAISATTAYISGNLTVGSTLIVGAAISANSVTAPRVFLGDGTAANPSLAFNSDGARDTGLYWGGDGYVNFTTNGVYAGQVQPSGHWSMVGNLTVAGANGITLSNGSGNKSIRANSNYFQFINAAYTVAIGSIDDSGNLTMNGNVTAYSDPRLKKDWRDLPSDFIERLANLQSGTFTRTDINQRQVGVNALQLQAFLPEATNVGESGYLAVAYGNAALAACVELAKEVVSLRERLNKLEQA